MTMAISESTKRLSSALRSLGAAMIEMSSAILSEDPETIVDEWITSNVAADMMGCTRQSVKNRAMSGKIKGKKIGRDYMFSKQSVENYISIQGNHNSNTSSLTN